MASKQFCFVLQQGAVGGSTAMMEIAVGSNKGEQPPYEIRQHKKSECQRQFAAKCRGGWTFGSRSELRLWQSLLVLWGSRLSLSVALQTFPLWSEAEPPTEPGGGGWRGPSKCRTKQQRGTKQEMGGGGSSVQQVNIKQKVAGRSRGSKKTFWFCSTSTQMFWFSFKFEVLFRQGVPLSLRLSLCLRERLTDCPFVVLKSSPAIRLEESESPDWFSCRTLP